MGPGVNNHSDIIGKTATSTRTPTAETLAAAATAAAAATWQQRQQHQVVEEKQSQF